MHLPSSDGVDHAELLHTCLAVLGQHLGSRSASWKFRKAIVEQTCRGMEFPTSIGLCRAICFPSPSQGLCALADAVRAEAKVLHRPGQVGAHLLTSRTRSSSREDVSFRCESRSSFLHAPPRGQGDLNLAQIDPSTNLRPNPTGQVVAKLGCVDGGVLCTAPCRKRTNKVRNEVRVGATGIDISFGVLHWMRLRQHHRHLVYNAMAHPLHTTGDAA